MKFILYKGNQELGDREDYQEDQIQSMRNWQDTDIRAYGVTLRNTKGDDYESTRGDSSTLH